MPAVFPTAPDWFAEGGQTHTWLGRSAGAGDVNGDGYSDLIVGAPRYDNGQTDEGGAFAYYGSAAGLSTTPDWIVESNNPSGGFGVAVESAGDVNGDGYDDAIVGANLFDGGQTNEGAAFLYYGSVAGLASTPAWSVESNQYGAEYGVFVDTAGDVNGDGYADVIVGARYYDGGGRAFVYHGGPAGLSPTPNWTGSGSGSYGICVATLGDVNADGYDDVIVGAYRYSNGQSSEGAAYAYYGSAAGLSPTPNWKVEGNAVYANLGWMVAPAGDVNGDGYDDAFVSATFGDGYGSGMAYVYHGSAAGLEPTPGWTVQGEQTGSRFGFSGGLAGDVNGDGYDDVVVGALFYSNGQSQEGKAYLYLGAAGGLSQTPVWTVEGEQTGAIVGDFAGNAGDVNGDGGEDWVIGAPWYDNGQADEGIVYVYYGEGTPPPPPCEPVHDVALDWVPLSPEVSQEVTFTATAAGTPPFDYQWQFGDGATGSGSPITHAYAVAGTYAVTVVASNACGQAAANRDIVVVAPPPSTGTVAIDIKPGSCPNPVQRRDHGVLPVAILGSATFDVTTVDVASIRLQGVAPLQYSYEDVSRPMVDPPDVCNCTTEGPDGYVDLVLHFDVQAILATLPVEGAESGIGASIASPPPGWLGIQYLVFLPDVTMTPPGEQYVLTLTAISWAGDLWSGQDCIILLGNAID